MMTDSNAEQYSSTGNCTDSSDIEILSEDKDESSDSIEVLDPVKADYVYERLDDNSDDTDSPSPGVPFKLGSGMERDSIITMVDPEELLRQGKLAGESPQDEISSPENDELRRNKVDLGEDPGASCSNQRIRCSDKCESQDDKDHVGDDSSTDSISMKTVESALPSTTDNTADQEMDSSDGDISETTRQYYTQTLPECMTASSCYPTSDSDSSFYEPRLDSSDSEFYGQEGGLERPASLSLPRPLQFYERKRMRKRASESSLSEHSRSSSTDALIEAAASTPLHAQGTIERDGGMIAFVAEGLQEMIRRSSPLPRKPGECSESQTPSARSVSSSASGWSTSNSSVSGVSYSGMSRSPSVVTQSPEDVPPIDPRVLIDLEAQALGLAHNVYSMMKTLQVNLHKMSSLTVGCVDAYQEGVDHTCDSVDAGIKSMYALMAKCEECTRSMRPIYPLQQQIKEVKRLLDLFEGQMSQDTKGSRT